MIEFHQSDSLHSYTFVIFTIGVSASGKSTWAESIAPSLDAIIICRDEIRRRFMEADGKKFSWKDWKWKNEGKISHMQSAMIDLAINTKKNVIIADTNLNPKTIGDLSDRFIAAGYYVYQKTFPISWEEAIKRDNARENGVGYSVIAKQFEQWYKMFPKKEIPQGYRTALCDLDGTLAHMVNRSPYDWDKVDEDVVDDHLLDILQMQAIDHHIIFVSGRDGCCYEKSLKWLSWHCNFPFSLYMRRENDSRADDIVKEELLHKIVEDGFQPVLVFDDRPRVCRMWRSYGLKVVQIGNPYIEF